MFVLCEKCNNHYDDTSESSKCGGVGRQGHSSVQMTPIRSHVVHTTEAHAARNRRAKRR